GIELTKWQPSGGAAAELTGESQTSQSISRADLVKANACAADFFRAILRHPEHGKLARETIARRGISPEMVEAFGVGASPDRWDGLVMTIQKQGWDARAFA